MTDQLRKIARAQFQFSIQRSSVVERSAVNPFQEHFRASAFSPRDSLETRFLEGKHRSKHAISQHLMLSPNQVSSIIRE